MNQITICYRYTTDLHTSERY